MSKRLFCFSSFSFFLLLIILACAPRLLKLNIDPTFNYNTIANQSIYITPIINRTGQTGFEDTEEIIKDKFREYRPYYKVILPGEYFSEISDNASFKAAQSSYIQNSTIDAQDVIKIGRILKKGYIAFSKFTNLEKREYESRSSQTTGEYIQTTTVNLSMYTDSRVDGHFSVYDLTTGALVFDAEHYGTGRTENFYMAVEYNGELVLHGEKLEYPAPAPPLELVKKFYNAVIQNIPQQEES